MKIIIQFLTLKQVRFSTSSSMIKPSHRVKQLSKGQRPSSLSSLQHHQSKSKDLKLSLTCMFLEGEVVWAKITGYPWWPGLVKFNPDNKHTNDEEFEYRNQQSDENIYRIQFFAEESHAYLEEDKIAKYSDNLEIFNSDLSLKKYKSFNRHKFTHAVELADTYLIMKEKKHSQSITPKKIQIKKPLLLQPHPTFHINKQDFFKEILIQQKSKSKSKSKSNLKIKNSAHKETEISEGFEDIESSTLDKQLIKKTRRNIITFLNLQKEILTKKKPKQNKNQHYNSKEATKLMILRIYEMLKIKFMKENNQNCSEEDRSKLKLMSLQLQKIGKNNRSEKMLEEQKLAYCELIQKIRDTPLIKLQENVFNPLNMDQSYKQKLDLSSTTTLDLHLDEKYERMAAEKDMKMEFQVIDSNGNIKDVTFLENELVPIDLVFEYD